MGDVPGVHGRVRAMVEWDPDGPGPIPSLLVAGGLVQAAGPRLVNNIATWDGVTWSTLGNGLPLTSEGEGVESLLVHDGQLFAAGSLLGGAGGQPLGSVVRWTGTDWMSLGQDGTASALAEFNGGIAAAVAVGVGVSRVVRIVWWNGSVWQTLGTLSGDPGQWISVSSLILDNGALVAGGYFNSINGVPSNGLARWTGAAWEDMGLPAGSQCLSAASNGSDMVVSDRIDGTPDVYRMLRRDGTTWIDLPGPPTSGTLLVSGGDIYATDGGCCGGGSSGVWRLAGLQWLPLGTSMLGVRSLASFRGQLVAGGDMEEADGRGARGMATWDGVSWRPLSHGMSTSDYGPTISVSGGEVFASQIRTDNEIGRAITRWNGHEWGTVLTEYSERVEVYQGDLILSFDFSTPGLRRYNGSTLESIGPATLGFYVPYVLGGRLFAVPIWWSSPGVVFRLDESGWTQLGPTFQSAITSLDMVDGQLYIVGAFDVDAGIDKVARWDGTAWVSVGTWQLGLAAAVNSVIRFNGQLLATGYFEENGFAILNGDQWQIWPSPFNFALARLVGDELVAIGLTASNANETLIAAYDGATWRTLGTVDANSFSHSSNGANLQVYGDGLVIAGWFVSIDGLCSNMFARLPSIHCCGSADFNHDGDPGADADIAAFFACIAGNCCASCGSADFNFDGDVATDADIEAFFRVLAGGNC
jgi:hypothetical protein